jgi:hypothetical protein
MKLIILILFISGCFHQLDSKSNPKNYFKSKILIKIFSATKKPSSPPKTTRKPFVCPTNEGYFTIDCYTEVYCFNFQIDYTVKIIYNCKINKDCICVGKLDPTKPPITKKTTKSIKTTKKPTAAVKTTKKPTAAVKTTKKTTAAVKIIKKKVK